MPDDDGQGSLFDDFDDGDGDDGDGGGDEPTCPTCPPHAKHTGWCPSCPCYAHAERAWEPREHTPGDAIAGPQSSRS